MKPRSLLGIPLRTLQKYLTYRLWFPTESYWDCFAKATVLSWDEWRRRPQMVCRTGYDGARAWAQAMQHGRSTRRLAFLCPADKERLQYILEGREDDYWTRQLNVMPTAIYRRWSAGDSAGTATAPATADSGV